MDSHEMSNPAASTSNVDLEISRREFCKTGLLAAGAAMLPAALVPSPADARSNAGLAYLRIVPERIHIWGLDG